VGSRFGAFSQTRATPSTEDPRPNAARPPGFAPDGLVPSRRDGRYSLTALLVDRFTLSWDSFDCDTVDSDLSIDPTADAPLVAVALPPAQACAPGTSSGFPIPDPSCTPGAVNPTLTVDVLRDREFTTHARICRGQGADLYRHIQNCADV